MRWVSTPLVLPIELPSPGLLIEISTEGKIYFPSMNQKNPIDWFSRGSVFFIV